MHPGLLTIVCCPRCQGSLDLDERTLACGSCGHQYPIVEGIPDLRPPGTADVANRAGRVYGYLWKSTQRGEDHLPLAKRVHVVGIQDVAPTLRVQGPWALDLGCGDGRDATFLADTYPDIQWIGLDIHTAVAELRRLARQRPNLHLVRGSAHQLPFRSGSFGFVYSYGVLHHLEHPEQGFMELIRVAAEGASCALYVYDAHEDNVWKRLPVKWVTQVRRLTTRLPAPVLLSLCWVASPFIVLCFALPARVAAWCPLTRSWSTTVPFHFARGPFSLTGDLYDRFGSPIEHRVTRQQLMGWFERASVSGAVVHPRDVAGWVGWGEKQRTASSMVKCVVGRDGS